MKRPRSLRELYEIVNPKDLLEVLDFCGINDNRDKEHSKLKREFSNKVWESIKDGREKEPIYFKYDITDAHYETIIKCIQDFYYWGHEFDHVFGHIYKRVMNALEIPMEMASKYRGL